MIDVNPSASLTPPPSSIQGRTPTTGMASVPSAVTPGAPAVSRPAPMPAGFPTGGLNRASFGSATPAPAPAFSPPPAPPLAAGATGTPPAKPPLQPAQLKKSPPRFLPLVVGALLVAGLIYFVAHVLLGQSAPTPSGANGTTGAISGQTVTLTYWGLWEPTPVVQEVFTDFENTHPGIKVNYQAESYQDYRARVQNAIAAGQGPDVFRFHASWTPMMAQYLDAMPASVFTPTDFANMFYPAAVKQLTVGSSIVGVPLMYDGLALYINDDVLKAANAQAPQTWADLKDLASKLTIRNASGIQRAGLAIGNATNVDHFSDILALLILQNGGDPAQPTSQNVTDALTFYTNFVKTDQVWNDSFANSTTAFARGDVAMMFAPSWRAHDIIAQNPNRKFTLYSVPQLTSNKVAWASFWAEGVSSQSTHKAEAWQLLQYLSTPDVLRKFYSAASKNRAFGELYPRKDMASELASQPYANPYLVDAPYAQGWYMSSATHDSGLNDQIIQYYQNAVTAVDAGTSQVSDALQTVASGVSQVLTQYHLGTATAASTTSTTSTTTGTGTSGQ